MGFHSEPIRCPATVAVLMSTYNGERFLREQLDSILAQNFTDFALYVRDDGSKDGTVGMLRHYAAAYPGRIEFVEDGRGNLGVIRSFEALLEGVEAAYYALADQDDFWKTVKVGSAFQALSSLERDCGGKPSLVYSDLEVVDGELAPIAPSFFSYMDINPDRGSEVRQLCVQNCVVGCTTLFNRPLRDLALPFPATTLMHDWWLALCAAGAGRCALADGRDILYRQHGGNQVGAASGLAQVKKRLRRKVTTWDAVAQACSIADRIPESSAAAIFIGKISKGSLIRRKLTMLGEGVFKSNFTRTMFFYLLEWRK